MTFVKGETTWGVLREKIIGLVSGVVADDFGTTVSETDRWRRLHPTLSVIAPPASMDVQITQEHRAGYWTRIDDTCIWQDRVGTAKTFCRSTGTPVTWHVAFLQHLLISTIVTASNTTPGDYSTAVVKIKAQSVDTGTYNGLAVNSILPVSAAGEVTWTYAAGSTFTMQLGDPSGTLGLGAIFHRTFTDAFRGGFDVWDGYGKATGAATYSIAPLGTAGTDYSEVRQTPLLARYSTSSNYAYSGDYTTVDTPPILAMEHGLGIKTGAGLTGARYVVSFPMSEAIGALRYTDGAVSSDTWNSRTGLSYTQGGFGTGPDAVVRFGIDGSNSRLPGDWGLLSPFTTPPGETARVEYWISVTPEHIAIALNGDSAYSGTLTQNMIAKVTSFDTDQQTTAWYVGGLFPNINTDTSSAPTPRYWNRLGHHTILDPIKVKGFRDGGRDWQTGTGRFDMMGKAYSLCYGFFGSKMSAVATSSEPFEVTHHQSYNFDPIPHVTERVTSKLYADQRWAMQATGLSESLSMAYSDTSLQGLNRPAGYVDHGILLISKSGFASGDTLTDSTTGAKYLLWIGYNRSGVGGSSWGLAMEQK